MTERYDLPPAVVPSFKLGWGGLLKALKHFEEGNARLIDLMNQSGIVDVVMALLQTSRYAMVQEIINQQYPVNCGGCNLCIKLAEQFHLLEVE
jgi:hypothetical protein